MENKMSFPGISNGYGILASLGLLGRGNVVTPSTNGGSLMLTTSVTSRTLTSPTIAFSSVKDICRDGIFENLPEFTPQHKTSNKVLTFRPNTLLSRHGRIYISAVIAQLEQLQVERLNYENKFNSDLLSGINPATFGTRHNFNVTSGTGVKNGHENVADAFEQFRARYMCSSSRKIQNALDFKPEDLEKLAAEIEYQISYFAEFMKKIFDELIQVKIDVEARTTNIAKQLKLLSRQKERSPATAEALQKGLGILKDLEIVFVTRLDKQLEEDTGNVGSDCPSPDSSKRNSPLYKSMDRIVRLLVADVQGIRKNITCYLQGPVTSRFAPARPVFRSSSFPFETEFDAESAGTINVVTFYLFSMIENLKHARFGMWSLFNKLHTLKGKDEIILTSQQLGSLASSDLLKHLNLEAPAPQRSAPMPPFAHFPPPGLENRYRYYNLANQSGQSERR